MKTVESAASTHRFNADTVCFRRVHYHTAQQAAFTGTTLSASGDWLRQTIQSRWRDWNLIRAKLRAASCKKQTIVIFIVQAISLFRLLSPLSRLVDAMLFFIAHQERSLILSAAERRRQEWEATSRDTSYSHYQSSAESTQTGYETGSVCFIKARPFGTGWQSVLYTYSPAKNRYCSKFKRQICLKMVQKYNKKSKKCSKSHICMFIGNAKLQIPLF